MSAHQRARIDAAFRQGPVGFLGDVTASRTGFEELMRQIPLGGDTRKSDISVGGVAAVEVASDGGDSVNVILYFHGGIHAVRSAHASVPLSGRSREADACEDRVRRLQDSARVSIFGGDR
jgi:hypothetical protein